jgi:hypothetical protein
MPAVDLLFDRTAASGPPWVLLFGDLLGEAPARTLEFAAQFDELRFDGRASSIIPCTVSVVFPEMTFVSTALYQSKTQRPTVAKVLSPWSKGAGTREIGISAAHTLANRAPLGSQSLWCSGLASRVVASAPQYSAIRHDFDVLTGFESALHRRLEPSGLLFQSADHAVRLRIANAFQVADRLGASRVRDFFNVGLRRSSPLTALWNRGAAHRLRASSSAGGAWQSNRGWQQRFQNAWVPRAGSTSVAGPVIPPARDPCYLPDTHLLFDLMWTSNTGLVFICERHATPLPPHTTVVVPIRRIYTRDDFDVMVREVLEDTFALFSLSAFRKGVARQAGTKPPPLARLEYLRSRADLILGTMSTIAKSPRHFLRAEEVTVPSHRANRATGPDIIKSFRSGMIRTETVVPSRLPLALGGRLPAQITMRHRRNSVDIPEHRQIKACLKSWAAWLSVTADALGKLGANGDSEIVTTADSWAVRARHISRRLNAAAQAGFMAEVCDGLPLLRMSSLFRNDPNYQRFYRLWQEMNLGLAAVFGDFLNMPLARTYELYELWCFLRLLRAATEEYGSSGVDLKSLFVNEASGGVTISSGAVVVPIGGDRSLCFQRKYREYWVEPDGRGSFSRDMIPDIVFVDAVAGKANRSVIVLDAKYRINDGLNDALNSIHTYRDALVQEAETGSIEGVVTSAYLLTPHIPVLSSDFKDTPVPGRLFHPQYREKFRFGAVTLRPGMSGEDLRACLRSIVADAAKVE